MTTGEVVVWLGAVTLMMGSWWSGYTMGVGDAFGVLALLP